MKSPASDSTAAIARVPEPSNESPAMQRDPATVTIANIGDQDFYISRTYGIFHIPASAKGEPYSLLLITARGDALDLGDNRRFPFTISAREIAEKAMKIAGEICIYTNSNFTVEEL